MLYYICDGTIEGLLTAVFHKYANKADALIASNPNVAGLIDEFERIETNPALAQRVLQGIKRYDSASIDYIETVFCMDGEEKYGLITNFLDLLFKHKRPVRNAFAQTSEVYNFYLAAQRVQHEANRLCGFIRLKETASGVLYGKYTSDHDVLCLILPHFAQRFSAERIILHDEQRRKIGFAYDMQYHIEPFSGEASPALSSEELFYQTIWHEYLQSVTIQSRTNKKLQSAFYPLRYRRFSD